jgi:hypothetical protein
MSSVSPTGQLGPSPPSFAMTTRRARGVSSSAAEDGEEGLKLPCRWLVSPAGVGAGGAGLLAATGTGGGRLLGGGGGRGGGSGAGSGGGGGTGSVVRPGDATGGRAAPSVAARGAPQKRQNWELALQAPRQRAQTRTSATGGAAIGVTGTTRAGAIAPAVGTGGGGPGGMGTVSPPSP